MSITTTDTSAQNTPQDAVQDALQDAAQDAPTQPVRRSYEMTVRISHGVTFIVPKWVTHVKVTAGLGCFFVEGESITVPAGETLTIIQRNKPLIVAPTDGAALLLKLRS